MTEIANIQPAVYDGMVFLSTSTAGLTQTTVGGNTGKIYALDEKTGMIRWNFDTVDSKNVWGNPTVNGGGGCYFPPAVETSTGLTYWGTDGPAPFPGTDRFPNGSSRPGANRYTNSMLALNAARGSLQWASQTAPHDLFGRSLTASPILATVEIGGLQKDIVIGSGETGTVSAFNRKDGTLLWATPVGRHENDGLTRLPDAVTRVYPAAHGGVEMPMALCEGTLYAAANNTYADFTQADCSPQSILDGDSEFVAMAIDSGKVIWDKHLDAVATSPPTVVNDLVLLGTLDGNVHALDRNSGQELWTYHASPDTSTGWAAVGGDTIVVAVNKDGIPSLLALKPGADRPYVNVVSPVNDSWISPESDVTVTVQVFNFNITDNVDAPNRSGEGHLIYYLNVDAATAPGKSALTTPGTYAISSTTSHTWKGLPMIPDGGYGFWVQLVNNDNTPLVPPALDVASVNIVGFHPD